MADTGGFEGQMNAGLFHIDKKCGASGIPDKATCTKSVGKNTPDNYGGEDLSGAKKGFKSFIKSQGYDPKKVGANSPLSEKLGKAYDKKLGKPSEAEVGKQRQADRKKSLKKQGRQVAALGGTVLAAALGGAFAINKLKKKDSMDLTPATLRSDACWKGYVQKGTKRKGNRVVPNCMPVGKAKAEMKRKTGQDGEDKLTSAKREVWAEGFTPKKTKARR